MTKAIGSEARSSKTSARCSWAQSMPPQPAARTSCLSRAMVMWATPNFIMRKSPTSGFGHTSKAISIDVIAQQDSSMTCGQASVLVALLIVCQLSSNLAAQAKSMSSAELALYKGQDREASLVEGATKEG